MHSSNFALAIKRARHQVVNFGDDIGVGRWQGFSTVGRPDLVTREVIGYDLEVPVHRNKGQLIGYESLLDLLREEIKPNLPWADDHFAERVGGVPLNPDPSHEQWPWWDPRKQATAGFRDNPATFKFTHTYSERFWPKHAQADRDSPKMRGIRYDYGDLNDVADLLFEDPFTRQAYLPIFFPEDTGVIHRGRVPCTLGYHFLLRPDDEGNPRLHLWYFIRSCDLVRHFQDDIYLAVRLMLWMIEKQVETEIRSDSEQVWVDVKPGIFFMRISSLHYHMGDQHHVQV